jgi:four helix bundle protein
MATILVIDDDPTSLGLLRTRLERAGYRVKEATDGKKGLEMAEKDRPDLIFLDVRMPTMDGWQVCRSIKSNPATRQCVVIMLTGCSQDVQELYGLECGADAYITKPWDARELLKTTGELLNQSKESLNPRSPDSQQRIKQYIQRVVRVTGNLPKTTAVESMTAQLLRLATTLMAGYQTAVANGTTDFAAKLRIIDQHTEELLYWLELLRDSKASADPEIPMLIAEGKVLHESFAAALKHPPRK